MDKDKNMAQTADAAAEDKGRGAQPRAAATQARDSAKPGSRHVFRICAVVALLCAVAGWAMFYYLPVPAVVISCVGICASVAGLRSGRGWMRGMSVTAMVACAVLVLVYAAFYVGLTYGVRLLSAE